MDEPIDFRVHGKMFRARKITVTESMHLVFCLAKALGRSIGEITEIPDYVAERIKNRGAEDDDEIIFTPKAIKELLALCGTLISGASPDELMSLIRSIYSYASVEVGYKNDKPWFAVMNTDAIIDKHLSDLPLLQRFDLAWEILKINIPELSVFANKKKEKEKEDETEKS